MAAVSARAQNHWIERVNPRATLDEAHAAIMSSARIIDLAADQGCDTVILGCGARLKLKGDLVATVLPSRHFTARGRKSDKGAN